MGKPKILFIFFQTESLANGGVNSLIEIINNLNNVTPVILTQRQFSSVKIKDKDNLHVFNIKVGTGVKYFFSWLYYQFILLKVLFKNDFQAVHINDIQALLYSILLLKIFNKRILFNLRGVFEKGLTYGVKWKIVNWCSRIIVLSQSMRKSLKERLPLSAKRLSENNFITPIYSIVNFNIFKPQDVKVHKGEDEPIRLLYVAAFNQLKNQHQFIEKSANWIREQNVIIDFVGDDSNQYGERCKKLVKLHNLENRCFFHGFQKNIHGYYQKSDFTLVLSKREGLARCMIESISCGTPVISFDVCSAKEILLENKCGFVLNQGAYNSIPNVLDRFLKNPDELHIMKENGIRISRDLFSKEKIIEEYESIYLS